MAMAAHLPVGSCLPPFRLRRSSPFTALPPRGGLRAPLVVARYSNPGSSGAPRPRPMRDPATRDTPPRREKAPTDPAICRDRFAHLKNEQNGAEIFVLANNYHPTKVPHKIPQLIEKVKPNVVALEICEKRMNYLMDGGAEPDLATLKHFYFFDTRMHYLQAVLRNTFLQLDEPLSNLCKTAIDEAQRVGAQIAPIDIDIDTTVSMWEKALLDEDFVTLSDRLDELPNKYGDFNRLHASIGEEKRKAYVPGEFPNLFCNALTFTCPHFGKVVLDDRTEYMVRRLKELKGRVVAIIGATHLDGIVEAWKQ